MALHWDLVLYAALAENAPITAQTTNGLISLDPAKVRSKESEQLKRFAKKYAKGCKINTVIKGPTERDIAVYNRNHKKDSAPTDRIQGDAPFAPAPHFDIVELPPSSAASSSSPPQKKQKRKRKKMNKQVECYCGNTRGHTADCAFISWLAMTNREYVSAHRRRQLNQFYKSRFYERLQNK